MHAHTSHHDLESFIKYDALHRRPLYLQLGLTNHKSDKVWVVWRETFGSPLLSMYGKRGSNLRVGNQWNPLHRVSMIRKKIEEKLRKGYAFEMAYTLNDLSDFGEILSEVKEVQPLPDRYILRNDQGEIVVEVPSGVGREVEKMVVGQIPKHFIS